MRVGSLFSGIGGIDIGFEQAGFSIAWAIEKDVAACKTFRANYPNVNLIENDIRNVTRMILMRDNQHYMSVFCDM